MPTGRFGDLARGPVRFILGSPSGRRQTPEGDTPMGYGVIGSTTDSGSVSLGSSPCTPALIARVLSVGRDSEKSHRTGMVSSAAEER